MDDLVGVVSGDLLGIGDESGKECHVQMAKFKGGSERIQEAQEILTALAFMGELIAGKRHLKFKANKKRI